jgi:hypothetical protein
MGHCLVARRLRAQPSGLALICAPKVPVGIAENFRVCRSQAADFARVPVRQEKTVFPVGESRAILNLKTASLAVFFWENPNVFHGTETDFQSITCKDDMCAARVKHNVSTGTFGMEIKARPSSAPSVITARADSTTPSHRTECLSRVVFHGKRGELRQHYREGQEDQLGHLARFDLQAARDRPSG